MPLKRMILFLAVFMMNALAAQTGPDSLAQTDSAQTLSPEAVIRSVPGFEKRENRAFQVGEYLEFNIKFGPITAGTASMAIPDTQWVNGRPCYHIETLAKSNKTIDKVFKVRDTVATYIDMDGLFPWRFEKRIREGKYKSTRLVEYDQVNQKVYYKRDTLDVPPLVQGILSSFYYVRTLDLKVGQHFDLDNFGDGKLYPLRILVHKRDRVRVPAGDFKCIIVEPVLRQEGIFNQKGRMAIWLTDDERRLPVMVKSKILIGSIDIELKKIGHRIKSQE